MLLERLVQSEQRPQVLSPLLARLLVLPWRVLLLVQPRLVLLAPEGQWWSFRRFLR